jgi:hypothetical protein
MSSAPYVDIAGLISVQKNYLANLQTNSSTPTEVANEIIDINKNIDRIGVALSHNSSAYILSGQKTVYDIVQREQDRLNSKKDSVKNATEGQNRLIELNTNYKKRYSAYTNMIIIGIITLILLIIILFMRQIPMIPPFVLNTATIIILVIATLMISRIFVDINIRDSIYYDELDTNSSFMKQPKGILADISNNVTRSSNGLGSNFNNILSDTGFCYGASCCSGNTFWDEASDVCVPFVSCDAGKVRNALTNTCDSPESTTPTISSMTTMNSAYQSGDISIADFSPSEYSKYGKL